MSARPEIRPDARIRPLAAGVRTTETGASRAEALAA